jgi:hypothetical protein
MPASVAVAQAPAPIEDPIAAAALLIAQNPPLASSKVSPLAALGIAIGVAITIALLLKSLF